MKTAVAALLLALAAATARAAEPVTIQLLPDPPLIEAGRGNQLLNFDFILTNATDEKLEISSVEVTAFAPNGAAVLQRRVGANGLSVLTIPNRFLEPKQTLVVFNPIYAFDADADLSNLHYEFAFDVGDVEAKYRAGISVHPQPYAGKTDLILPVSGRVLVHDGHDFYAHHRRLDVTGAMTTALGIHTNMTRYAYDFSVVDAAGRMFRGDGGKNEDWFGWGTPIYAPGDGVVVEAARDVEDNTKEHRLRPDMQAVMKNLHVIFGNYVVLDHESGEFSVFAHMKKDSVTVKPGDRVKQGQAIGAMGMSGDAFTVHLHYQLQRDAKFGEGLPSYFRDFRRFNGARWISTKRGAIDSGDIVESLAAESRQLAVVTTANADAIDGTLQRYSRASTHDAWTKTGDPIPVVVGRNGIAIDKREGDGRAPAGVFAIGPAFGFAPDAKDLTLPYLTLLPTTECVDDAKSAHYNTIVDRAKAGTVDWTSSEKMRDVQQYRRGAVVQYNAAATPGAGSCIFLHIWGGPSKGTAGCTAMSAADLDVLLRWLSPSLNPRLVIGSFSF
jgi:L,D-peptidoglycan transpeptidase YkuD (ErfK/YbiS/YcfS/YnhG family)